MDFFQLGQYLRDTRQNSERTLEEATTATRVRQSILQAFEMGDFASLDDTIRIRGFLRMYADWLQLNPDQIIAYYEQALSGETQSRRGKRGKETTTTTAAPIAPRRITDTPRSLPPVALADARAQRGRNLLITLTLLILSATAVIVIAFVTVEIVRTPDDDFAVAPTSDTRSVVGIMPPTSTFTPSWTPRAPIATATATPIFVGSGVLVELSFSQRTYLRVLADGGEQFSGIVRPGDTLQYEALNAVSITAGNAASLTVVYNGVEQSVFGVRGQQVEVNFTPNEVEVITGPGLQPTPIASPTPLPLPTSIAATVVLALTPTQAITPTPLFNTTIVPTLVPTLTAPFVPTATDDPANISPTPIPVVSATIVPTDVPSPTIAPTATTTPTSAAIVPPRLTPTGLPPTKSGA